MRNVLIILDIPTNEIRSARSFHLPCFVCFRHGGAHTCQECLQCFHSLYSCLKELCLPWDIEQVTVWVTDFHCKLPIGSSVNVNRSWTKTAM